MRFLEKGVVTRREDIPAWILEMSGSEVKNLMHDAKLYCDPSLSTSALQRQLAFAVSAGIVSSEVVVPPWIQR